MKSPPITHITPRKGLSFPNISEMFYYRDLFWLLARKDVLVKYKQTIMGPAYAVVQPFFSMVVFTIFFGKMASIPNDDIPYPLFYYSALVPWTYFSGALQASGTSLVMNSNLLTKIYFPRAILPLVPVFSRLVNFAIALVFIAVFMIVYDVYPSWAILYLPILVLLMMLCAAGVGMWMTALNIKYRDVQFGLGFLVQFWMFASPVIYPYSMLPEKYRLYYALNPMTGVIEGFRTVLVGNGDLNFLLVGISAAVSVALFATGAVYFSSVERMFADVA